MLTKDQFTVLNNYYNASIGRLPIFSDIELNEKMSRSYLHRELIEKGYINEQFDNITPAGVAALEPYRVSGAVILAAGPSTRCIPLSLEMPKAMFEVKGEKLIEREICQLREAGIEHIAVVIGHMKERFYYLAEKYQVELIENIDYLKYNNIFSLYLAKDVLPNAYVCSCDNYFAENPFNQFEYESFSAGIHLDHPSAEMYLYTDEDERIIKLKTGLEKGKVILGHSYWNKEFADTFVSLIERDMPVGKYADIFWEWMLKDFIDELPPFYYKEYAPREITEIDYFDDLRRFDSAYVKQTHSKIIENIISVFQCDETEILDFRNVSEGMTNTSFIFKIKGIDYIYRHPGDGTEKIVNRQNEKKSLETAKKWDIDPTYVYMDVKEGWKISSFVTSFREPDYTDFEDSKKIIKVLQHLHSLPVRLEYGLKPWEDAEAIEKILIAADPNCFKQYEELKKKVYTLYQRTIGDGVEKCFCHGDTYKPNWMIKPDGEVILIDWEYSGYSDPGIDVGYYIIDAMYEVEEAERFIGEYLGASINETLKFHYLAYASIIAYYWFVWALYRESCGAYMGEALVNWRDMAYRYAYFLIPEDL